MVSTLAICGELISRQLIHNDTESKTNRTLLKVSISTQLIFAGFLSLHLFNPLIGIVSLGLFAGASIVCWSNPKKGLLTNYMGGMIIASKIIHAIYFATLGVTSNNLGTRIICVLNVGILANQFRNINYWKDLYETLKPSPVSIDVYRLGRT